MGDATFRITSNGFEFRIETKIDVPAWGPGRWKWEPISTFDVYQRVKCYHPDLVSAREQLDLIIRNLATLLEFEPVDDQVYAVALP